MIFVPRKTSPCTISVSFCTVKETPAELPDVLFDVIVLAETRILSETNRPKRSQPQTAQPWKCRRKQRWPPRTPWNQTSRSPQDCSRARSSSYPRPANRRPYPRTIREPTLGLPGAALDGCNVDQYRSVQVVPVGAWVALPRRVATLHGQSPPGNYSRGSVAHHRTCLAALTNTWLAPSFTSQAPHKGRDLAGY